MFDEEEQDRGCALMVAAGLPLGRWVYPLTEFTCPNAVMATEEDGEFWYGDLAYEDMGVLQQISGHMGKNLYIYSRTDAQKHFEVRYQ